MSTTDYQPWDREDKLGPPPWKHDDPKVIAWEAAHGHDVRSKCYPEFGCQVLPDYEAELERLRHRVQAGLEGIEEHWPEAGRIMRAALNACCSECGLPLPGPHRGTCSQSLMRGGPAGQ
jgi:hypothetical protein